jgi:hypothetical protein
MNHAKRLATVLSVVILGIASAPAVRADIRPNLRESDAVVVVEKGKEVLRAFIVEKCPAFRDLPLTKALAAGKGPVLVDEPKKTLKTIEDCAVSSKDSSIRELGSPTAQWVLILSTEPLDNVQVKIEETARKTRFENDLQTLLKILMKGVKGELLHAAIEVKPLQFKRANVAVTVAWTDALKTNFTVVTGPPEHLYLSADLPIDNVSMLKYDESSGAVSTTSAPTKFYGGLNWSLGDIGLERASWSWSSLSIKLLMQISSKPLDGLGAGLGFRLPATEVWGFKLNVISVFGAVIWLREDASATGTPPVVETHYKAKLRGGLSLNLDAALGWIKG